MRLILLAKSGSCEVTFCSGICFERWLCPREVTFCSGICFERWLCPRGTRADRGGNLLRRHLHAAEALPKGVRPTIFAEFSELEERVALGLATCGRLAIGLLLLSRQVSWDALLRLRGQRRAAHDFLL